MKRLFSFVATIALLTVPLSLSNAYAQGAPTGVITGVVKDEAGAVVPGERITAVNPGASASFQTVANDTGIYTLRALPVGSYNVRAEKEGFKKALQEGVVVRVNEEAPLDVTLSVGAVTEAPTIASQATTVDTISSTLKNVIDQRRINVNLDLPNGNRSSSAFGRITAAGDPRILQFALRLGF